MQICSTWVFIFWDDNKTCMLLGLLVVVAFEARKMPTVDWIEVCKIHCSKRTMYVSIIQSLQVHTYVSKSCVEQCLKAFLFMLIMGLVLR